MSEVATQSVSREWSFIKQLRELAEQENRAALAALRRGLGRPPGLAPETYPYVVPYLADKPRPREEAAYFLTAMLFALWHQGKQATPNQTTPNETTPSSVQPSPTPPDFGASLAELRARQAHERGQAVEAGDSLERRFVALLSSEWNDLPYQLRQLVNLLRTREVPIDWEQLLRDLQRWDDPNRQVQRHWARSFWRAAATDESEGADAPTTERES